MRFFLCSIFMMISPIWPLGENPLPGDPYVIVNKRTNELAVILDNKVEGVYSVATGKTDDLTPEGEFSVTVKAVNPYYRKKSIEGDLLTIRLGQGGSDLTRKEQTGGFTEFTGQTGKTQ